MSMANLLPRDEYMRLLYEQAAREQRELAERVRAAYGSGTLAADFERWAADLERLAGPRSTNDARLDASGRLRANHARAGLIPSGLHLIFADESPAGIEQAQAGLPASRFPLSGHQDTGVGKRGLLHLDRPTGRLVPTDGEPTVSPAA